MVSKFVDFRPPTLGFQDHPFLQSLHIHRFAFSSKINNRWISAIDTFYYNHQWPPTLTWSNFFKDWLGSRLFYVCKLISYARFPPKRVNQFELNFEGVFSSLSAFVRDMYRLTLFLPCRDIFPMEHIWENGETLYFRFRVETGSWK